MEEIVGKIMRISASLPLSEKKFADALLENSTALTGKTLSQIAMESGASEAAIIRFCKRMGMDGYTQFKEMLNEENSHRQKCNISISQQDNLPMILTKLYENNLEIMKQTLAIEGNDYERVLRHLLRARSVHFFAVGDANVVARLFEIKFTRVGVLCTAPEDIMLQMITANNMTSEDVAIAISYEGRSRNVVEAMRIAKERGAFTVSITRAPKSPLMQCTDVSLMVAANDVSVGKDKVTRRLSDQFILEGLYMGFRSRMGEDGIKKIRDSQRVIDYNKIK